MQVWLTLSVLAAAYQAGSDAPVMENCNDEAQYGAFKISTLLNRGGNPYIGIRYRIPKSHIHPAKDKIGIDSPTMSFGFRGPLSSDGYHFIGFYNFRKLFEKQIFPIRSMTFKCGRKVTLIGDTSIQPYPLNGIFVRESLLRGRECIRGLKRDGYYKLSFEELEGEKRTVRVEGRADFAGAIAKAEQMARRRLALASAGQCVLNPPPPPPT